MKKTQLGLRLATLVLCLAMVLSLAACGGSASSTPTPADTTPGDSTSAPEPARAEAADINDRVEGGDMIFGTSDVMGEFFTPYKQGSLVAYGWPAYQTLAMERSDHRWDPCLAESWERDDDNFTLTVHLTKDAVFSDGSPFTAEDVVFSLASRAEYGTDSTIGSPVSIEATDDYTVVVTWDTFSLSYERWILGQFMFSKKAFDENGLDWMLNNMMGTGPYVLSEFIPDVSMTFTRNENYWGEAPSSDSIKFLYITDPTTLLASFMGGEIDRILASDPQVVDQLTAAGYQTIADTGSAEAQYLAIPLSVDENDPFYKQEVRQAVFEYGVDWNNMALGLGGSVGYHTDAVGMKTMTYYTESLEKSSYDLEKAKQMLADAGYPDGFKTMIYTSAPFTAQATVLQSELLKLGIEAECEFVDYSLVQSDYISAKAAQNGICITCLFFPVTPQTDRFVKHINPTATYGASSTCWTDTIQELWTAVPSARSQEDEDKAMNVYVDNYVHEMAQIWPMYNTRTIIFVQEWAHFTEDAMVGSSLDPAEIWTTR